MGQTETEKQELIRQVGEEIYKKWYGDEGPWHEVCVDGFWMGRHEVTRDQFRRFIDATGYKSDAEKEGYAWIWSDKWEKKEGVDWRNAGFEQDGRHPVVNVSWNDARAMAKWITDQGNGKFRLPTEAEWEYACRAGTNTARFWGNDPDDACRYANVHDKISKRINKFKWTNHDCDDGYVKTAPVGSFRPNNFGLYDMLGNVWEWCDDIYAKDAYSKHSRKNSIYTNGGSYRVIRGGGWESITRGVRCALRGDRSPGSRFILLGFRLLRTL